MRLLVTGGSGFLGQYVLAEAARRGHACVALARSPESRRGRWPAWRDPAGGRSRTMTPRWPACSPGRECEALVNLASLGFGHAPAIVARGGPSRARPGRLHLDHRGHHDAARPLQGSAAGGRGRDPRLQPELDDPAADDDLRRPRRQEPVPAARPARAAEARVRAGLPLPVPGGGRQLQQPVHVADLAGAVLTAVERRSAAGGRYDVACPEPLTFADLLRASAGRGRRPRRAGPGAPRPGDRRHPGLPADQPQPADSGGAVAAAGRGQGLSDRRRRPRPGLRAPPVRGGHPRGSCRPRPYPGPASLVTTPRQPRPPHAEKPC